MLSHTFAHILGPRVEGATNLKNAHMMTMILKRIFLIDSPVKVDYAFRIDILWGF